MNTELSLNLPKNVDAASRAKLEEELRALTGVEDAFEGTVRGGFDPNTIRMVIELGTSAVAMAAAAVPVLEKILALVRGHGIPSATLTTANGAKVEAQGATVAELQALAASLTKT